jgi:RNA polymerase sigma factor (sigma-70 family)
MKNNKYHSYTDEELVKLSKETGDKKCMEELYNRYIKHSINICFRYVHEYPNALQVSEDIAQSVFVMLHDKLKAITIKSSFSLYLFRILQRECYKYIKQNPLTPPITPSSEEPSGPDGGDDPTAIPPEPGEEDSPGEEDDLERQLKKLKDCLRRLPPSQRQAIELYWFSEEEKAYDDISREMGEDPKTHLQNGMRNLRHCMGVSFNWLTMQVFLQNIRDQHLWKVVQLLKQKSPILEPCVLKLPEIQKKAIIFFFYNGKLFDEIAQEMKDEIKPAQVRRVLIQALVNLTICLEN